MVYFIKSLLCHAIIVIVGWLRVGKAWVYGNFWGNFHCLAMKFFGKNCIFLFIFSVNSTKKNSMYPTQNLRT
jgi:hypothetical protein